MRNDVSNYIIQIIKGYEAIYRSIDAALKRAEHDMSAMAVWRRAKARAERGIAQYRCWRLAKFIKNNGSIRANRRRPAR